MLTLPWFSADWALYVTAPAVGPARHTGVRVERSGGGEVKTKPKWFRININVSSFLSNCLSLNIEAQPRNIITFTFHKMSWDAFFARVKHEVIIFWRDTSIKIMNVISLACILPSSGHMLSHHKSASQLMTKELKSQRPKPVSHSWLSCTLRLLSPLLSSQVDNPLTPWWRRTSG